MHKRFALYPLSDLDSEGALASAPHVPLQEVRLTPGMQTPRDGFVVPNDEPGFGLGLTLDNVQAMAV